MRMRKGLGLILALLVSTAVLASAPSRDQVLDFSADRVHRGLDKARTLYDEKLGLPKKKMLGRDQANAQRDIDKQLDRVLGLLESSELLQLRKQNQRLEEKIEAEREMLAEARKRRLTAPEGKASLRSHMPGRFLKGLSGATRGDYEEIIRITETNIAGYERSKEELLEETQAILEVLGSRLSLEQVKTLLSTVTGDDIVSMTVVYNAVRDISVQLERIARDTGEDLEYARKYYGMVVALFQMLEHMQDRFVSKVEGEHLPKLNEYRAQANQNIKEARGLLRQGTGAEVLEANIHSNQLTLQVIDIYTRMLKEQSAKVKRVKVETSKQRKVAENTYKTVTLSSAVSAMIREGVNSFEALINLQMPDIQTFENREIQSELSRLTQRMGE